MTEETTAQRYERHAIQSDLGSRYSVAFDGFVGTVIGSYRRLDGEEGVVMQQDGCKVVHVYRRKWLEPVGSAPLYEAPPALLQQALDALEDAPGWSMKREEAIKALRLHLQGAK